MNADNRYYAYDKKEGKFVTVDGELAEVGEKFKQEMLDMNITYITFISKDEYEEHKAEVFAFEAMDDGG